MSGSRISKIDDERESLHRETCRLILVSLDASWWDVHQYDNHNRAIQMNMSLKNKFRNFFSTIKRILGATTFESCLMVQQMDYNFEEVLCFSNESESESSMISQRDHVKLGSDYEPPI